MTGFESWVRAGLVLGVRWILDIAKDLHLEFCDGPESTQCPLLTPDDAAQVIAQEIMERWPAWKVEAFRQPELALGEQPPAHWGGKLHGSAVCARCKQQKADCAATPHGPVCTACLGPYIDRKWPENPPSTL